MMHIRVLYLVPIPIPETVCSPAVVYHTVPLTVRGCWRGSPGPSTVPPELVRAHVCSTHWGTARVKKEPEFSHQLSGSGIQTDWSVWSVKAKLACNYDTPKY